MDKELINNPEPEFKAPKRIKLRLEQDLNSLRTSAEILGLFTDTLALVLSDFIQSCTPPNQNNDTDKNNNSNKPNNKT